jgi:hypothetical protein
LKFLSVESVHSNRIELTDMSENIGGRDALHLLAACHPEWRTRQNPAPTRSSSLRSTITTATFAVLQKHGCTELHPGLPELKQRLKPGEVIAEIPNGRRVASHLQFCSQVHKWQL